MNKAVFDSFPTLITKRLLLRRLYIEDAEALFDILSCEKAMVYYGIFPLDHVGLAKWFIEQYQSGFIDRRLIRWGIIERESNQFIGSCGFQGLNEASSRSEIGYELHPDAWQKGYMQEALKAIISWGFESFELNRIEALIYPENTASAHTVEKLGFTKEACLKEYAYFRETFTDLDLYRLLKREYLEYEITHCRG
jgi:ribosomal-protein-alanine N-acetyltransferase